MLILVFVSLVKLTYKYYFITKLARLLQPKGFAITGFVNLTIFQLAGFLHYRRE